jgi:hypothetical protein
MTHAWWTNFGAESLPGNRTAQIYNNNVRLHHYIYCKSCKIRRSSIGESLKIIDSDSIPNLRRKSLHL